ASGVYSDPAFGPGPINAIWDRAAGSKDGTCRLSLRDLGLTFTHAFELIQFEGPLAYTMSGSAATGALALRQKAAEARTRPSATHPPGASRCSRCDATATPLR